MKKRITQKQKVLEFLQTGRRLTPLIAMQQIGLIGSTLAYHIHILRSEGWDIKTHEKVSAYNGSKYAEYTLASNWRLVSEQEKRESISKYKPLEIRDLRIGDRVLLTGGARGYVTSINASRLLIITTDNGIEHLVPLIDVIKKLR